MNTTAKIPPTCDRYAYSYGWVSSCMRNVEYATQQMRLKNNPDWVAYWMKEIENEIASFKAIDDALHETKNSSVPA